VALPLAQRWATEHDLAPAALCDERDVARKGGQLLPAAPPSVGEPSSWPERSEHSPSVVWLWQERVKPLWRASWERVGRSPCPRLTPWWPPRWSPLSWPVAGLMPHYQLSPWRQRLSRPFWGRGSYYRNSRWWTSKLPRRMGSLRENPLHIRHSPSVATVIADEETIRTSRGKARCKSLFLVHQLSVFFTPVRTGFSRSRVLVLRWSCEL
jgi:hypothetical protein